jgi:hypothetical protein
MLSHVSKVFAAKDAKIYPLTADPASGSPTYGTGIDVPGLKTVTISGDVNTAELRGDNQSLDQQSVIGGLTLACEFAKLSLDILSAIFAAATADSGTTPNQKSIWTLLGTTQMNYIGFTCQAVGADSVTGDVQFSVYKAVLSSFPEMGLEEEDYKTSALEFAIVPLLSNGKWIGTTLNETAAALAAPA